LLVKKERQAYFNFINSLNSEYTKKEYGYCLDNFLNHSKLDLNKFLKLPEDKKQRRKELEDIIQKATGTHTGNLEGGHLHFRNPTPDNSHSGTHGGSFTWDLFCDLSLEELGELQNKRYYTEKSTGQIKDSTGQRVAYDHSTKRVETTKDR
jgi:hypothetical protein